MKKNARGVTVLVSLLLCAGTANKAARAETVYLKDGTVVKGKIIEKYGVYVKMEVRGAPRIYGIDEIEKIEKDNPFAALQNDRSCFIHDALDFGIVWPDGWIPLPNFMRGQLINRETVVFEMNYAKSAQEFIPFMSLLVLGFEGNSETADESGLLMKKAGDLMEYFISQDTSAGAEIAKTEGPVKAAAGDNAGVMFTVHYKSLVGEGGKVKFEDVKYTGYLFPMERRDIVLAVFSYVHGDKRFPQEWGAIESSLKSIVIPPREP